MSFDLGLDLLIILISKEWWYPFMLDKTVVLIDFPKPFIASLALEFQIVCVCVYLTWFDFRPVLVLSCAQFM